jgi:phenylacetic acid degradation operon negative regulatory protein
MLAGLIALLAPFGINERLVRTSVFRLAREGWLQATPVGRESLYRLTRDGARRFEQAYQRIYAPPAEGWDDTWELVLADGSTPAHRRALMQELGWAGFGMLAPGVCARPATGDSAVARIATALRMARHIVVVRRATTRRWAGARSRIVAPRRGISRARCALTGSCCASAERHRSFSPGGPDRP